ncbi:hypothetical protein CISG_00896 [Coccidioides immitis RMSCC 3703]|uniref:Uncharacterized protein n=1 Tax=Coccidioides immitis RMSCC 3703 TaxID=454286 RepID=A0A0J8TMM7_COCIT|nr:hypothetical protein CISG_00896 [Coccidioides immitis RMSCC 3703]
MSLLSPMDGLAFESRRRSIEMLKSQQETRQQGDGRTSEGNARQRDGPEKYTLTLKREKYMKPRNVNHIIDDTLEVPPRQAISVTLHRYGGIADPLARSWLLVDHPASWKLIRLRLVTLPG